MVEATPARSDGQPSALPSDGLILVAVREIVLFPGTVVPISVQRPRSVAAAQEAARRELPLGVLLQRDPKTNDPSLADLHPIGTQATILRYVTARDGVHHVVAQGLRRFRVLEPLEGYPFLAARVEALEDDSATDTDLEARVYTLRQLAAEAVTLLPQVPAEIATALQAIQAPGLLADWIAGFFDLPSEEKQKLLEMLDVRARLEAVHLHARHRLEVLRLSQQIERKTKEALGERQREMLLREQMRQIQRELGEDEDGTRAEIEEVRSALDKAVLPPEATEHAEKELKRLERMPEAAAEYSMLRSYLDWLAALPWSVIDPEEIDIQKARAILDEDHYGLQKVKERILEYLAVRKLAPQGRSPILCFVGPPGVGKTSLGRSIARAVGLRFVRTSLGGVHDEAEIRGHRRTYIGALPGNIIQGLRKAGSRNPVFLLDEIDKLGYGMQGDPAAALLEVLDPEQNSTFRDNYIGLPFDLSRVFFIATANLLDGVPGPLRDRLELIELSGYSEEEKVEIAKRYVVPRQLERTGLGPKEASLDDEALRHLVRDYTREAGCRQLERTIAAVLRRVAMRLAEGSTGPIAVGAEDLHDILGAPRYENEVAMRTVVPGVATGLAWTPVGGDILFIEAGVVPGTGRLILTGQLGDVMKESAQAALTLVKTRAAVLGIDGSALERSDIHVHVPAGAIPKDGPSAGVALFVALVSLLSHRIVRSDVAMTGEISLRGLVLPVGGIPEKVAAAARAGIRTVLLPARNKKDLDDLAPSVREALDFVWLEQVDDALEVVFEPAHERSTAEAPSS